MLSLALLIAVPCVVFSCYLQLNRPKTPNLKENFVVLLRGAEGSVYVAPSEAMIVQVGFSVSAPLFIIGIIASVILKGGRR